MKFKKRCIDADLIYKTFKNVSEGIVLPKTNLDFFVKANKVV